MKKLKFTYPAIGVLVLVLGISIGAQTKKPKPAKPKPKPTPSSASASDEVTLALKDALSNGVNHAVSELGRQGGYYTNPRVKIPLPEESREVVQRLRSLKEDDLIDDFVVSMNRAAEQAIPEAILVFNDAIKQMTVQDAKKILTGPKDAATQYFRRTSEEKMLVKFMLIMKTATSEGSVLTQYKMMMEKGGGITGQNEFDLDEYITQKALDGVFLLIADEEKRIREDPAARTTTVMQKVFGSLIK